MPNDKADEPLAHTFGYERLCRPTVSEYLRSKNGLRLEFSTRYELHQRPHIDVFQLISRRQFHHETHYGLNDMRRARSLTSATALARATPGNSPSA